MPSVKIEQVNRYTLTIYGMQYTGFILESEWEGMAKFVGPAGVVIVSKPDDFICDIFRGIFGESSDTFELIKATPSLLAKARAGKGSDAPTPDGPPNEEVSPGGRSRAKE